MIKEYKFGSITIDEKTYDYDLKVRWTNEVLPWRRKESHIIDMEDIESALSQNPQMIVIGTGESGMAEVTKNLKIELESRGIELIVDLTADAIKTFNVIKEYSEEEDGVQKRVIGFFHLTC